MNNSVNNGNLQCQRARWIFTLHNFNRNFDYRQYLLNDEFRIKRAVLGYEIAPTTGTRHIQGYIELCRSLRYTHVKRIFSGARWEPAYASSLRNYEYCTKSGHYEVIGDFTNEERGIDIGLNGPYQASVPMVIAGLLDERCAVQVKVSKEYAEKHVYFEKISAYMRNLKIINNLFEEWKIKKLYPWQYKILTLLANQPKRQILWICDTTGNNGKTFLGNYLHILYRFSLLDGTVNARDVGNLLDDTVKGFCFDVSRASARMFDYGVLEALKNGYVISGKYVGKISRFRILPIIVFANVYPNCGLLSEDRWRILTLGEGILSNLAKHAVVSPSQQFPFVRPPVWPDLSDKFDLRAYLTERLPQYRSEIHRQRGNITDNSHVAGSNAGNSEVADPAANNSQVAGPAANNSQVAGPAANNSQVTGVSYIRIHRDRSPMTRDVPAATDKSLTQETDDDFYASRNQAPHRRPYSNPPQCKLQHDQSKHVVLTYEHMSNHCTTPLRLNRIVLKTTYFQASTAKDVPVCKSSRGLHENVQLVRSLQQ